MRRHQVRKAYSKDPIEAKRTTRLFEFNIREFMSRLIVSRDLAFYPLWNLLNNTISIPKDEAESFFPTPSRFSTIHIIKLPWRNFGHFRLPGICKSCGSFSCSCPSLGSDPTRGSKGVSEWVDVTNLYLFGSTLKHRVRQWIGVGFLGVCETDLLKV